jgi:DNA-binding NarL/FixJ family response regulator
MIKVLLAEDHQIVRNGIKNVLETEGRFQVVGEAANGKDALRLIDEGKFPDIVLADLNMPEMSGIELAQNLKKQQDRQNIKVVALTMLDNENYVFEAFRHGIQGYLLKNISTEELLFALSHVNQNNLYICSDLAARILKRADNKASAENYDIDFSKRETEVLSLIASGYTNKEIADKLFTSRRTVEGHRQTMINKANVRNSAELIRFAVKHSLID